MAKILERTDNYLLTYDEDNIIFKLQRVGYKTKTINKDNTDWFRELYNSLVIAYNNPNCSAHEMTWDSCLEYLYNQIKFKHLR